MMLVGEGGASTSRVGAHRRNATGSDNYLEVMATCRDAVRVSDSLKAVLGARVRDIRSFRGLTQEALAEELNVSPRYLAGIERGERNLTLDSVDALAVQLGTAARKLLDPDSLRLDKG